MASWKKVIVSGSDISQLVNDANYLVSGDNTVLSGSFSGSFQGDGSGLTNVPASGIALSELSDGNGINDFTYNGQGTATVSVQADGGTLTVGASGVKVSDGGVGTTQLANSAVTSAKLANDSVTSGKIADGAFSVTGSGDVSGAAIISGDIVNVSLSLGAGVVDTAELATGAVETAKIADGNVTFSKLAAAAIVTEAEGIASNDVDTAVPTAAAVKDYVDNNVTAQDLDFAGDSGTGAVDLDSQSLTIAGGSGLTSAASGQTLTLNISASGVTNAMLEGSIANDKLANSSITIGDQTTSLGGTVTAFSGSFTGDGSGLTNVPASGIVLAELSDGNGIADFTYNGQGTATVAVDLDGSTLKVGASGLAVNELGVDTAQLAADAVTAAKLADNAVVTANIVDANVTNAKLANSSITLTADGGTNQTVSLGDTLDIAGGTNITTAVGATDTVTVNLDSDITVDNLTTNQDLTVSGDLTVIGTASFQHTDNLEVADRFILLASGSNTSGDGGIIVQQATQNVGEAFFWDTETTRWGVADAINGSVGAATPDAFMASVVEGAGTDPDAVDARYDKKGNIFVGTDEAIWIYS